MKKTLSFTVVGSLLCSGSHAAELRRFYIEMDAGGIMQQDLSIKSDVTSSAGKIQFDTGFRDDLIFGYRITDSISAELNTGFFWNSIDKIQGDSPSSSTFYQVPFIANGVYQHRFQSGWTPYGGAGVGGTLSMIDLSTSLGRLQSSEITLGYQAFVGVRYALNERWEVGLAYKFFGTPDHHWTDSGIDLKTDGSFSHSLTATLVFRF